jgi:hypothetical protein
MNSAGDHGPTIMLGASQLIYQSEHPTKVAIFWIGYGSEHPSPKLK